MTLLKRFICDKIIRIVSKPKFNIIPFLINFGNNNQIGYQRRGYVRGNYKKSIEKKKLKQATARRIDTSRQFIRKPVIEYPDYKVDDYDGKRSESEKKNNVEYWNNDLEKRTYLKLNFSQAFFSTRLNTRIQKFQTKCNRLSLGHADPTIFKGVTFSFEDRLLYLIDVTRISMKDPNTIQIEVFDEKKMNPIVNIIKTVESKHVLDPIICDLKTLVETLCKKVEKYAEDARNDLIEVKNLASEILEEDIKNGIPEAHIKEFKRLFSEDLENSYKHIDEIMNQKLDEIKETYKDDLLLTI
nr:11816_t:CDS:2 [Entrophospora candida]